MAESERREEEVTAKRREARQLKAEAEEARAAAARMEEEGTELKVRRGYEARATCEQNSRHREK